MKNILLLIFLVGVVVGCGPPKGPVMKRVVNYKLIDEHYLKDVFVPSYGDQGSRSALSNSVVGLYAHLDEFRDFMHQVEAGKIPVTQGFKGNWQSYIKEDGAWIAASYTGREGLVVDFQKHKNQDPFPLIYGFQISNSGYLKWATTIEDGFQFDEDGKVRRYWHK